MKKIFICLIIFGSLAILAFITYRILFHMPPYKRASALSKLKIPSSVKILKYEDEWFFNGNGYTEIEISATDSEMSKIIKQAISKKYKPLPTKTSIIQDFIEPKDYGYYYSSEKFSESKLILISLKQKRIFIYYAYNNIA